MNEDDPRHKAFTGAMLHIYKRALKEAGYRASKFLDMVNEHGGYQAASILIHASLPSDGYTALWMRKRLDLTVEALILRPQWHDIFTEEDRTKAYERLKGYRFNFGADYWMPPQ